MKDEEVAWVLQVAQEKSKKKALGRENNTCKGPEVGENKPLTLELIQPVWLKNGKVMGLLMLAEATLQRTL